MEIELPNGQIAEFPDDMPHEHIERLLQSHFPQESSIPSIGMKEPEHGAFYNLMHGIGQGYPHALKGDINAVSQLVGRKPFDVQALHEGPLSEKIGQGLGAIGGHLTAVIPAAIGSEALIPGLAGASLGAGLAGAATTPGGYKERLTSGLLEAAIPAAFKGVKEAGKIGIAAIRKTPTPRMAADVIQKTHAAAKDYATQPLNEAKKLFTEGNLGPIRIRPDILNETPKILGKDQGVMQLLDKAKQGDYVALDKLQSDLRKESRLLNDPKKSHADRLLGKSANSLADKILNGMKIHAEYKGRGDISNLITEGKSRYKDFAQTWLTNPTVAKLVGKEKIVPKNLLSKLESDTAFFNKFKSEVPEISKMLELQKSKKAFKKSAKIATGLTHAGALGKYLSSNSNHSGFND